MRKLFLAIHKWLSIPFGIFISIMCFTGALMLFRNEISAFFGYASGDMPFFKTVMKLHRWLMLVPENPHGGMSAGRFVMGLSAIAATLILISGIVLWWPRDGKRLKSNLSISFSHGWRRFMRDSHVALGAYACIFLLLMSLTGPVWSFGWYRSAAVAVIGGHEGERPGRKGEADIRAHTTDRSGRPEEAGKRHGASAGMQAGGRGQKPAAASGHRQERAGGGKAFPQKTFISLHTGKWGGVVTKVIYFLAVVIGGCLPISGYYLWSKKASASKRASRLS